MPDWLGLILALVLGGLMVWGIAKLFDFFFPGYKALGTDSVWSSIKFLFTGKK